MTRLPQYADPRRYVELAGFTGDWRELWWNADFLDLMVARLGLAQARDVLDVGCGAGHWGRTLLPRLSPEAKLTGVDREPHFVELAQDRAPGADAQRLSYLVGDASSLPFPDGSFDLVTCQTLLIHIADVPAVLRELRRVTRPGGVVLAAEPDNLAGNLALLGGDPAPSDQDVLDLVRLQQVCDAGKRALREGDNRIGARLPGLFAQCGLGRVHTFTNDRCISLFPPYDGAAMKIQIEQERGWIDEGVSILLGSAPDNRRFFIAGGGDDPEFDRLWQAMQRWLDLVRDGIDARTYHAARGFVFYLVSGTVPA